MTCEPMSVERRKVIQLTAEVERQRAAIAQAHAALFRGRTVGGDRAAAYAEAEETLRRILFGPHDPPPQGDLP